MGHVPSKELCTEPFAMDVYSRSRPERLVAIALTKYYFPSVDDPLFQKLCEVRNENHVKNWFYRPPGIPLDVLPHAPSDAQLYEYYIEDATKVVNLQLPPHKFTPMPLMVVKMNDASCRDLPTVANCVVMGMIGSRHFEFIEIEEGGGGSKVVRMEQDRGITQIFMSNSFYNEVKSISCFRLGCACFQYFCKKAGLEAAPWPMGTGYETAAYNLPLFKLTQQLNYMVHDLDSWIDDGIVFEEKDDRVYCGVEEATLAVGADGLGNSVDYHPGGHRAIAKAAAEYEAAQALTAGGNDSMPTSSPPPLPAIDQDESEFSADGRKKMEVKHSIRVGLIHGTLPQGPLSRKYGHLEDILERAKPIWKDANRAVAVHQVKKTTRGRGYSRNGSRPGTSESTPNGTPTGAGLPTTGCNSRPQVPLEPKAEICMTLEEKVPARGELISMFSFDAPQMKAASRPTPPASIRAEGSPHTASIFPDSKEMPAFQLAGPDPADLVLPAKPETVTVDPRVYLGDRTPVTIRTSGEQWVPKFWRNPLQHLTRSSWQPHLDHGFVAYTIDHYTMVVYDHCWYPEVLLGCSPFVFIASGETMFKLGPSGEYLPTKAE